MGDNYYGRTRDGWVPLRKVEHGQSIKQADPPPKVPVSREQEQANGLEEELSQLLQSEQEQRAPGKRRRGKTV